MNLSFYHGKFFKDSLGRKEVAESFLTNVLDESIMSLVDLNTLRLEKDTFIDASLQEHFADLLYKVSFDGKDGYIYVLFEHKSCVYKNTAFQLLKYMTAIWEKKSDKKTAEELPMIIPILFYQGEKAWNIKKNFSQLIAGYDMFPDNIKIHVPDFEYLLFDVSKYIDEKSKNVNSYLYTVFMYIFNARRDMTKDEYNSLVLKLEKTYPEGCVVVMTLAELFKEEGREEGIRIEKINTTIKLLTKKVGVLSDEIREKIKKLDKTSLDIITDNIFDLESLEDLNKYLG